jgi:hypothetical protein
MRIRRTLPLVLTVVILAAAVTVAVQLRKHAPPEPARLLPAADAFLYADFSWVRKLSTTPLPPVSHDPEYDRFIAETGFEFERDLDAVAFAAHYPGSWQGGGSGGSALEPRFSEVFIGRFDGGRLTTYLKHMAQATETYDSVEIYTIPVDHRAFRVAILSVDSIAASNQDDPGVIRGIVDRSRRLASPFGGPALLRRYYKRVQLASPVWLVAHIEPSAPEFSGWSMVFAQPADLVVSASYNPLHLPLRSGVLRLRAEASTGSDEVARQAIEKITLLLANFHAAEASVGAPGSDADLKAVFDSIQLHQEQSRAVLSATLPTNLFRKVVESPSQIPASESTPSSPQPSHAR